METVKNKFYTGGGGNFWPVLSGWGLHNVWCPKGRNLQRLSRKRHAVGVRISSWLKIIRISGRCDAPVLYHCTTESQPRIQEKQRFIWRSGVYGYVVEKWKRLFYTKSRWIRISVCIPKSDIHCGENGMAGKNWGEGPQWDIVTLFPIAKNMASKAYQTFLPTIDTYKIQGNASQGQRASKQVNALLTDVFVGSWRSAPGQGWDAAEETQ